MTKFNKQAAKEIPIRELARTLGIDIKKKQAMCFTGHDKETASLNFDDKKNLYHCFGCGIAGDSIKLVQDYLNIDFREACVWIAEHFSIPYGDDIEHIRKRNTKDITKKKAINEALLKDETKPDPEV